MLFKACYGGDQHFLWIMNLLKSRPILHFACLSAISTYVVQKQTSSASSSPQMQMHEDYVCSNAFIYWLD